MIKVGTVFNGRYEVQEAIYSGSSFQICLAQDKELQRPVAVKLVRHRDVDKLLRDEALQMAKLEHPHLIPIYDFGVHDGRFFLVMRYISKQSMSHLLRERVLSLNEILRIAQRIGNALSYLQTKGLVHGNLKASNVMLDSQLEPYLGNFVANFMSNEERLKSAFGRGFGTVYNLAPEHFLNKEITPATDLYAFGLMIYHCFTGQLPFKRSISFAQKQLDENIRLPSVHEHRPDLPIGTDLVLRRLSNEVPEQRYKTATEAVEELYRVFYSGQGNIDGKVFISYATKDKDYVHKLATELRNVGVDIWIDQDIEQGSNWDDSIEKALRAYDMLLLITTEASMDSAYVNHEWSYFMGAEKPVYPFVPNTKLPFNIHPRLNRLQLVHGTGDMLADIANIVSVLAGGNPKKLGGLDA